MKSMIFTTILIVLMVSTSALTMSCTRKAEKKPVESEVNTNAKTEQWPDMSVYNLTDQWTNHQAKPMQLKDLSGKPVVAAMVYTSCQHTCPMITQQVLKVMKSVPEGDRNKVTFALISFDSKGDTPEVLQAYKTKRKLDDNWVLLTAEPGPVRKLAGVLGVNYKATEDGGFSHSNIVSLIDKNGVVINQVNDLNQSMDDMSVKLKELLD